MTAGSARRWLLIATLSFTAAVLLFFLLAPALGYPLEFSQSLRLLEIVLPVFLGYLGYGSLYVFRTRAAKDDVAFDSETSSLLPIVVIGPLVVFAVAAIATIAAFGLMNGTPDGAGMSIEQFAGALSTILGLLNASTNIAVAYLFRADSRDAAASNISSPR